MKICMVTFQYPPMVNGGVASAVHRIARNLVKAGEVVHVVSPGSLSVDMSISAVVEEDVVVHRTFPSLGNHFADPAQVRILGEYIVDLHNQVGFDLLHGVFLIPAGFLATIVSKQINLPAVVSIRGSDIELMRHTPALFGSLRWTLENAALTTSVNSMLLEKATQIAKIPEKRVILNAFDPSIFDQRSIDEIITDLQKRKNATGMKLKNVIRQNRAKLKGKKLRGARLKGVTPQTFLKRLQIEKSKGSLIIGTSSILRIQKGFHILIESFERLLKIYPKTYLLVVGDFANPDDRKTWTERLKASGLDTRIFMTGRMAHQYVLAWMKQMDIFVLPSLYEGSPNALLEAMACGLPAVASDVGGVRDMIKDWENGLLIPVNRPDALAQKLILLAEDKELRKSLGNAARKTVEKRFSPKQETQTWTEIYRQVAGISNEKG